MNLDFGISTMIYYHERIEKLLPYLTDWKIKIIEIKPRIGHFEFLDSDSIDQLKKKIDYFKLLVKAIHMPINGVDISHLQEYERVKSIREVEKTVIAAFKLGAELVVIHPGGMCSNLNERKKRLDQCVASVKEMVGFCQQWNVKLVLENTLPGRLGDQWEEIQQIITRVSSEYLGICLDTGHYLLNQKFADGKEFVFNKEIVDWKKYLLHIHIHDNDGKKDLHLLPGEGYFPWASLLCFLKEIQYHRVLIVEQKEQSQLSIYLDKINQVFENLNAFSC